MYFLFRARLEGGESVMTLPFGYRPYMLLEVVKLARRICIRMFRTDKIVKLARRICIRSCRLKMNS